MAFHKKTPSGEGFITNAVKLLATLYRNNEKEDLVKYMSLLVFFIRI
jgi:hypothetical protein